MTIQNVNTRNASPGFAYLVMIFIYFTNAKRKKKKINLVLLNYSQVPNKQVGQNKRVGWLF